MKLLLAAAHDYGWLLSLAAVAVTLAVVWAAKPAPIAKDVNVYRAPSTIAGVQPVDVACKGAVTVGAAARGPFYRAILGNVNLTWTEGDDRFALTDGVGLDWPDADRRAVDCLKKRATR